VSASANRPCELDQNMDGSGPCPDLIAHQRSRDDVSSAAEPVVQPPVLATPGDASSALDTGGSASLPRSSESAAAARLLTADDVATVLRVPRSLIYALVRRGDLPAIRIGERYVRFRLQAIEHWLEQREAGEPHTPVSAPRRTISKTGGSSPTVHRGAPGTSPRRRANAPGPGIRRVGPDAS
jgi:excisionase family DNA binding protein